MSHTIAENESGIIANKSKRVCVEFNATGKRIKIRYSQALYVITPINTSNANGIKLILNSNKHRVKWRNLVIVYEECGCPKTSDMQFKALGRQFFNETKSHTWRSSVLPVWNIENR